MDTLDELKDAAAAILNSLPKPRRTSQEKTDWHAAFLSCNILEKKQTHREVESEYKDRLFFLLDNTPKTSAYHKLLPDESIIQAVEWYLKNSAHIFDEDSITSLLNETKTALANRPKPKPEGKAAMYARKDTRYTTYKN